LAPSQYLELDEADKVFIIAAIQIQVENEKREAEKLKKQTQKKGGRK